MSRVEPCGTWQYAQSVCCPAGARVGVEEALLRHQDEGPLGVVAAQAPDSLAAISSSVGPRCTVPACAHAAAVQGTGPSRARSSLNTPGPYR